MVKPVLFTPRLAKTREHNVGREVFGLRLDCPVNPLNEFPLFEDLKIRTEVLPVGLSGRFIFTEVEFCRPRDVTPTFVRGTKVLTRYSRALEVFANILNDLLLTDERKFKATLERDNWRKSCSRRYPKKDMPLFVINIVPTHAFILAHIFSILYEEVRGAHA